MKQTAPYLAALLAFAVKSFAQPANDDICNAVDLSPASNNCTLGSNNTATNPGSDPVGTCWTGGISTYTIWYKFTAPPSGNVMVTSDHGQTMYDTQLGIYSSSNGTCTGVLTQVGCNDDISGTNLHSEVPLTMLTPGDTYFIEVNGYNYAAGDICIDVHDGGPLLVNDACMDAMNLWVSAACNLLRECTLTDYPVNIVSGADAGETGGSCWTQGLALNTVWYRFTAVDNNTIIEVPVSAGDPDPHIAVYSGNCGSLTQIACQEDISGPNNGVNLNIPTVVGQMYYVQYDSDNPSGCNQICLHSPSGVSIPPNDDCAAAIPLTENVPVMGNNWLATNTPLESNISLCGDNPFISIENSVWYSFTPASTDTFDINITGMDGCSGENNIGAVHTQFHPKGLQMALYPACPSAASLACVAQHNENDIVSSQVLNAGQTYYIMVDGNSGMACEFHMEIRGTSFLPVELISFTGRHHSGVNILEWVTGFESANSYFTLERSTDGSAFEPIGTVPGGGTTTGERHYSLTDMNPPFGIAYYRLKQTDYSGKSEMMGKPVAVAFNGGAPFVEVTTSGGGLVVLLHNIRETGLLIVLSDVIGRQVAVSRIITGQGDLTIYNLPLKDELAGGAYFLTALSDKDSFTTRFIK